MTKNHLLIPTNLKSIMDVVGIQMDEISTGNCLPMTDVVFSRHVGGFLTFEDMKVVKGRDGIPVVKPPDELTASLGSTRPDTVVIIGKRAILVGQ